MLTLDFQAQISGPLLGRFDIHIEVAAVSARDRALPPPAEGTDAIAQRVARARTVQRGHCDGLKLRTNAEAEGELLDRVATPEPSGARLLADDAERTARNHHRVIRVAGAGTVAHSFPRRAFLSPVAVVISCLSGDLQAACGRGFVRRNFAIATRPSAL
jgi:predicted ATPase with chaperone activity